jgi:hypothetical protein
MKEETRRAHGHAAFGIEAEEPNARLAFASDVRAEVELGKALRPGTGGTQRGRTPSIRNGTMPIQASPPKVSSVSPAGTCGRSARAGTAQWRNAKSSQRMANSHGDLGLGQGR